MKENIESKYVGNRKMIIELRLKAKPIIIDRIGELAERMENEKEREKTCRKCLQNVGSSLIMGFARTTAAEAARLAGIA